MIPRVETKSGHPIPIVDLRREYESIRVEAEAALQRVLASGSYILGPETEAFEKELAAYCQTGQAIGVNSGTDAILLALKALDIGPGDDVILPAMTFMATAEPVVHLGARPVLADIDPVTYTLDPADVRKRVTTRTKAIIAVHLYGQMADMDALQAIATEAKIPLIEDTAQAIGAEFNGRRAGSFGTFACLSFFPTKNLGACGDGGAVLTKDSTLSERVRALRNHGTKVKYHHEIIGYNSRLDEIQAALLRIKLRRLDSWNDIRRSYATIYQKLLADLPLTLPVEGKGRKHVYHLYSVRSKDRDGLRQHLEFQTIASGLHYPTSLHLQPALAYLGGKVSDFPVSETLAKETLSLPLFPQMKEEDLQSVSNAAHGFFKTVRQP